MPYLVRPKLYIGNITDAANVLSGNAQQHPEDRESSPTAITHLLSVLSSADISFFTEWKPAVTFPCKEIQRVFTDDEEHSAKFSRSALPKGKLVYKLEHAGRELKVRRMAVEVKDTEDENLLDFLDVCLEFVDEGRRGDGGAVLVHCFAGVSRRYMITLAVLFIWREFLLFCVVFDVGINGYSLFFGVSWREW